jgi:hypothetical protein
VRGPNRRTVRRQERRLAKLERPGPEVWLRTYLAGGPQTAVNVANPAFLMTLHSPPIARHDVRRAVRDDCRREHPRGVRVGPAMALNEFQEKRLAARPLIQIPAKRLPKTGQSSVPVFIGQPCDMGLGEVKKFGIAASCPRPVIRVSAGRAGYRHLYHDDKDTGCQTVRRARTIQKHCGSLPSRSRQRRHRTLARR